MASTAPERIAPGVASASSSGARSSAFCSAREMSEPSARADRRHHLDDQGGDRDDLVVARPLGVLQQVDHLDLMFAGKISPALTANPRRPWGG
jgi:hypothetical protein